MSVGGYGRLLTPADQAKAHSLSSPHRRTLTAIMTEQADLTTALMADPTAFAT
jgi:hypothetical protein